MIARARPGVWMPRGRTLARPRARRVLFPSPAIHVRRAPEDAWFAWLRAHDPQAVFHLGLHAFAVAVSPGSSTFNSGTGATFTVPAYNTLIAEGWGGGGGGNVGFGGGDVVAGSQGGTTTIVNGADTLTAQGGRGCNASTFFEGSVNTSDATASGGDTNTTGNRGGAGTRNSNPAAATSGTGGGSPNGGGTAAGVSSGTNASATPTTGTTGTTPGGGASGNAFSVTGQKIGYTGSNSGAYVKKTYTLGVGNAPSIGASITYSVGAKGNKATDGGTNAADGAAGRVKFTWS